MPFARSIRRDCSTPHYTTLREKKKVDKLEKGKQGNNKTPPKGNTVKKTIKPHPKGNAVSNQHKGRNSWGRKRGTKDR